MEMTDWLATILIISIVLILLDGFRRKWLERKRSLRIKLDKNIPADSSDYDDEHNHELPNGGARSVRAPYYGSSDSDSADNYDSESNNFDNDNSGFETSNYDDLEQDESILDDEEYSKSESFSASNSNQVFEEELDDGDNTHSYFDDEVEDDGVPVLKDEISIEEEGLEVVEQDDETASYSNTADLDDESYLEDENGALSESTDGTESNFTEDDYEDEDLNFNDESDSEFLDDERIEPSFGSALDDDYDLSDNAQAEEANKETENKIENGFAHESFDDSIITEDRRASSASEPVTYTKEDQNELFAEENKAEAIDENSSEESSDSKPSIPQEVIVLNVMAKPGEMLAGKELLPILMKQSMRVGDMSIFHRYADSNGNGPILFSMANMVEPGTFDVSQMEEFTTPGISFFLQLPCATNNMECFEKMLEAADAIVVELNADIKDEDRNKVTRQTLEHNRERIRDFELKQLSNK